MQNENSTTFLPTALRAGMGGGPGNEAGEAPQMDFHRSAFSNEPHISTPHGLTPQDAQPGSSSCPAPLPPSKTNAPRSHFPMASLHPSPPKQLCKPSSPTTPSPHSKTITKGTLWCSSKPIQVRIPCSPSNQSPARGGRAGEAASLPASPHPCSRAQPCTNALRDALL